ncbi:hypothetical protein ACTFIY_006807 [Dictyostelium cf. discoideum]
MNGIKRSKLNYSIGFISCFLVVILVATGLSQILKSYTLFDQILNDTGLNFEKLENSVEASEINTQSSSGDEFHKIDAYGYPVSYCENIVENNIQARYFSNGSDLNCTESTCFINRCGGDGNHVYMGFQLLDFKKENDMGIKSTFGYGSQPKGTCLMVKSLAKAIELNIENPFELGFELGETIPSVLIDIDSFYDSMVEQVNPTWNVDLMKYRYLKEYVENIVMKFPSPRLSMYYGTDLDKTLQRVSEFTSKLIYKIGVGRVDILTPVMTELYRSKDVSNNLGQLLNLIVFVFLLLSILLIYTTLMIDVDSMTFNNGVFRMLGAKFSFIIELIVSKTIIFTVPSIIIGLIISQIYLVIIVDQLKRFTNS